MIDRALLAGSPPDAFAFSLEPAWGNTSPTEVLLAGRLVL